MNICVICGRIKNHSKTSIVSKKITIFARKCILFRNKLFYCSSSMSNGLLDFNSLLLIPNLTNAFSFNYSSSI